VALGHCYAASGKNAEALKVLDQLKEQSKPGKVCPYARAMICAGLGKKDQALRWLQRACNECGCLGQALTYLKVDPRLDSVRSDPRFQDLVRRMNFPP
jgi:hypothetical protein